MGFLGMYFVADVQLCVRVTRGFAHGIREHQNAMDASITVAKNVAVHLSRYECDEAQAVVNGEGGPWR